MSRDFKTFWVSFLAVFVGLLFFNVVQSEAENFILARKLAQEPPQFFLANIIEAFQLPETIEPNNCPITAQSAVAFLVSGESQEKIVFQKNASQQMAIASIAKLMSAIVADEFYEPDHQVVISRKAISQEENFGQLKAGEKLRVKDLLALMLIESSNDAAYALSEPMGVEGMVGLMNLKAEEMALTDTYFFNTSGLEPDDPQSKEINYSTALDLAEIGRYLLSKPVLLDILARKEYALFLENGVFHHTLQSTNKLLGEVEGLIGGKTGWTGLAGGCLLEIVKAQRPDSYYIIVVLNSADRFGDMRQLINCLDI